MGFSWFLLRRLAFIAVSLVCVSMIVFAIMEVIPGDIAQTILGRGATQDQVAALREQLGLSRPPWERYGAWLAGILQGDFGTSLSLQTPIGPLLVRRALNSLVLALVACAVGIPLAVGLGLVAGFGRPRWVDAVISRVAVVIGALPEFVVAMLLIMIFSYGLGWLPATSLMVGGDQLPWDPPTRLALPAMTLVLVMMAYNLRLTRASVARVLESDYVVAAELKGLSAAAVLVRHIAPNALLPTITVAAGYVGWMIGGLVVVEAVFAYPGVGLLVLNAARAKDVPLLEGAVLLIAASRMVVNLAADILYHAVDPRLRVA